MTEHPNPLKSIRLYCLSCVCGSSEEVKKCHIESCPLWCYRFGKNPYRTKRELTDEQRQAAAERLKLARQNKG